MKAKRFFQLMAALAILTAAFASAGSVSAWSGCAGYITVQWGDTLSGLAAACGTSVQAIRAANPGLGWWLFAGQGLYMPTGSAPAPSYYPVQMSGNTYMVRWGDTMGNIAATYGVSLSSLLAVNPQIWNASLIFPGQVINLPTYAGAPVPTYYPPYNPPPYNPPAYNPPSYYPYNCYSSTCYPGNYQPPALYPTPTATPPPLDTTGFSNLKVTYGKGLLVRTGPGKNFGEIVSPLVSAVKNTYWKYRKSTVTTDSTQFVWAEILLPPGVVGYSTGWILTRDSLGNYFTDPPIGAPIDRKDP